MPFVEVLIYGQRLRPQQKEELFKDVDATLKRVLGSTDAQVRIAIHEGADEDYYSGGNAATKDHI